ncbi:MAG: CRISPR-associated endonuclease Cas1 [Gammaproteobacteria bacterium]
MATLVLDRSNLELRVDGTALAFHEPDGRRGSVPMKLLERVVLQGQITLDSGVLTKLAELGVATLLLSRRQSRRVAVVLGPAHNDAAVRLAQSQLVFDERWQIYWSRRLVMKKTRAQLRLLERALAERPDVRKPLFDAQQILWAAVANLARPDLTVESIRGIEGAAARAYFHGLAALFPSALGFTGRNRRPPRDPVNACLSLGYTLLHFDAVHAAHIAGLDPLLGFYHRPAFGRESLASDLIEPLRPQVDAWVWTLFRERILREHHFVRDKGACLLDKEGRSIFYGAYDDAARPLRRVLRRQCRLLARVLRKRGEPLLEQGGDDMEDA